MVVGSNPTVGGPPDCSVPYTFGIGAHPPLSQCARSDRNAPAIDNKAPAKSLNRNSPNRAERPNCIRANATARGPGAEPLAARSPPAPHARPFTREKRRRGRKPGGRRSAKNVAGLVEIDAARCAESIPQGLSTRGHNPEKLRPFLVDVFFKKNHAF